MASPFRVFRKHQKKLLATLGIMAIVAFCIPVGFINYIRSPSRADQVVVKTSKYGDLQERELVLLRQQRQRVLNFLQQVRAAVTDSGGKGQTAFVVEQSMSWDPGTGGVRDPGSEEAVVDTWLCAKQAEQLGLVVNDEAITEFIREVTEDRLDKRKVEGIIRNVGFNHAQRFFELLRHELLALRLRQMFGVTPRESMFYVGLAGTTPAQRWDYYSRLKRLATIELIPVSVADYVDKIKAPSETTLQEFFEAHKDKYPNPSSPEPGFRRPHRIAVRYFKADVDRFMAPDVISDEEVKEYYEKNKERFDRKSPTIPKGPEAEAKEEPESKEPPEGPAPRKAEEPPEQKSEAKEPSGEEKVKAKEPPAEKKAEAPAEKQLPPGPGEEKGEKPEEKKEPTEKPATEAQKETGERQEAPAEGPANQAEGPDPPAVEPGKSDETSSAAVATPFRLASLLQEETDEADTPDPEPPAGESPGPATKPEEPSPEPPTPVPSPELPAGKPKPATEPEPPEGTGSLGKTDPGEQREPKEGEKPAEQPEEPPKEPPKQAAEPVPEPPQKTTEGEEEPPKDPLKGPLGETVRRELAHQKITEIFDRLQGAMDRYRNELVRYEVDVERDPAARRPKEPDFEALLRDSDPTAGEGLTTGQTALLSQAKVLNHESGIGKSFVNLSSPFVRYAYETNWPPYVAAQSVQFGENYLERNRFLFWKVEDSEAHLPVLDKEEVDKLVEKLRDEAAELKSEGDASGAREKLKKAESLLAEHEELQQEVLETWKMVQARELAVKAAEKLAEEARKAGLPLDLAFIDRPDIAVTSTRPFSWMTYGSVPLETAPTPPRLSEVEGVEMPGPDFMRAVFRLKKGQIGVTTNHPKTIAYVVRVIETNPPEDALWTLFTEIDQYGTYMAVAGGDQVRMIRAWQEELRKTAGLEWERPPQPGRNE